MTQATRVERVGLAVLVLGSLVLWLWGGTPFQQLDSIVLRARTVLENGGNPDFFHYPALVIYVVALPYGVLHAILGDEAAQEWLRASSRDLDGPLVSYFLPGHLVIVGFALLGVLAVSAAARRLSGREDVGLASGAILACSLLWITDAHLVTVDVPLAALIVLTAERTLAIVQGERPLTLRAALVVGVCAGLAAAAKYNGALVLAPVTVALALHARRRGGSVLAALVVPGAAALATFVLTNPFALLELDAFRRDLAFEWRHSRLGHAGYLTDNGFLFHLENSLLPGFGPVGLAAAALGALLLARARTVPLAAKVVVLGFPLLHFVLIGGSKLAFQRYMLPMLPFLALAAGATFALVRARSRPAALLALFAVVAPGVRWGIRHDLLLARPDLRAEVVRVLERAELDLGGVPVYASGDAARCTRWAGLPFDRTTRLGSRDLAENPTRVYAFDSFLQDRVLYDDPPPELRPYYAGEENVRAFTGYEDFAVLQFSPFTVPKEAVPVSRKSSYSPSLPDLRVRRRAGPFLELWFARPTDADAVERAARELGVEVRRVRGSEGWYVPRLRALALGRRAE